MPPRSPESVPVTPVLTAPVPFQSSPSDSLIGNTSATYSGAEIRSSAPMTVTQVNSPYSQSIMYDGSKTAVVKKRVPVAYQATVEWQKNVYPAQEIVQDAIQQPIYIIQEIPNFPLRKTTKPEPEKRERAEPPPPRERAAPPRPEPIYKDTYTIVEVPKEVVRIVEKKVQVPIEKVVYQDKVVEVPKEIIQENIKHIQVPVEKVLERKVPVDRVMEKVYEVPRERIVEVPIERIVEIPVEKVVEVQIPVEKRIEVPVDRVVEVPVERQVEELVLIESEPVFETRQRRVQVPVTVMQEQVIEEQVEVGYRLQHVQERAVPEQFTSQPRSWQYVERQRPIEQHYATASYAGQYTRQSSETVPSSEYGSTAYPGVSYGGNAYPAYVGPTSYSRAAQPGERIYSSGTSIGASPRSTVRNVAQSGQRVAGASN